MRPRERTGFCLLLVITAAAVWVDLQYHSVRPENPAPPLVNKVTVKGIYPGMALPPDKRQDGIYMRADDPKLVGAVKGFELWDAHGRVILRDMQLTPYRKIEILLGSPSDYFFESPALLRLYYDHLDLLLDVAIDTSLYHSLFPPKPAHYDTRSGPTQAEWAAFLRPLTVKITGIQMAEPHYLEKRSKWGI